MRIAAVAAALYIAVFTIVAQAAGSVSVLYAGSLVTTMEGPIKSALMARGIDFEGQAGGSSMLSNLISAGIKNPDVFIAVNPDLVTRLHGQVASASAFASTRLGIGWSDQSRFATTFDDVAAGKISLTKALSAPGLAIGRTDPRLDPKGVYTIAAIKLLAGAEGASRILGSDENPQQTFPEENLLSRIETGQADVGFFYETEAKARGLHFAALPGAAAMSDRVTYALAVMKNAPHPENAAALRDFILTGEGRRILSAAGLAYFAVPRELRVTACQPPCTTTRRSAVLHTKLDRTPNVASQTS